MKNLSFDEHHTFTVTKTIALMPQPQVTESNDKSHGDRADKSRRIRKLHQDVP